MMKKLLPLIFIVLISCKKESNDSIVGTWEVYKATHGWSNEDGIWETTEWDGGDIWEFTNFGTLRRTYEPDERNYTTSGNVIEIDGLSGKVKWNFELNNSRLRIETVGGGESPRSPKITLWLKRK